MKEIKIFKRNNINYVHFIFTRFNAQWGTNPIKHVNAEDEWMIHRDLLCKKYYLPSINIQTNKNFQVLMLFDKDTDKKWINFYNSFDNIIIIYEPHLDFLKKWLSENKIDLLITSRVDNDDAINPKYVEIIQNKAFLNPKDELLIDFKGSVFTLKDNSYNIIYDMDCNSPFISVSSNEKMGYKTAYLTMHSDMHGKFQKRIKIPNDIGFIQIVHDKNIINYKRGKEANQKEITYIQNNFKHLF